MKVGDKVKCMIDSELLYTGTIVSLSLPENDTPNDYDPLLSERIQVKLDMDYGSAKAGDVIHPIRSVIYKLTKLEKALQ